MGLLDGKVAVVTGGASGGDAPGHRPARLPAEPALAVGDLTPCCWDAGIGEATVRTFVAHGAKVGSPALAGAVPLGYAPACSTNARGEATRRSPLLGLRCGSWCLLEVPPHTLLLSRL